MLSDRCSMNLRLLILEVKINIGCLRFFLIGTNDYSCKQTVCQVYLFYGSGTKIVNWLYWKNVVYLLADRGFYPVKVIWTRSWAWAIPFVFWEGSYSDWEGSKLIHKFYFPFSLLCFEDILLCGLNLNLLISVSPVLPVWAGTLLELD